MITTTTLAQNPAPSSPVSRVAVAVPTVRQPAPVPPSVEPPGSLQGALAGSAGVPSGEGGSGAPGAGSGGLPGGSVAVQGAPQGVRRPRVRAVPAGPVQALAPEPAGATREGVEQALAHVETANRERAVGRLFLDARSRDMTVEGLIARAREIVALAESLGL